MGRKSVQYQSKRQGDSVTDERATVGFCGGGLSPCKRCTLQELNINKARQAIIPQNSASDNIPTFRSGQMTLLVPSITVTVVTQSVSGLRRGGGSLSNALFTGSASLQANQVTDS
jgi:hypothetical protein